jgi:hypothetical protein
MEVVLKYFGLDWLAMASSLLAVYLIGNKNRIGFISYILANVLWIYLGIFQMQSFGISIGNIFFLIMNLRGYLKWKETKSTTIEIKDDTN